MATNPNTLNLDTLHALTGRLLNHADDLAGRADVSPELTADVQSAAAILEEFSDFLVSSPIG
jgi:hypothetical protein